MSIHLKKKHYAIFRTKKNEIHSIFALDKPMYFKKRNVHVFFCVLNVKIIFQNFQVSHFKNLENSKVRKFSKRLLKCVVHVQ